MVHNKLAIIVIVTTFLVASWLFKIDVFFEKKVNGKSTSIFNDLQMFSKRSLWGQDQIVSHYDSEVCDNDNFLNQVKPLTETHQQHWKYLWKNHTIKHGVWVKSYSDSYVWKKMEPNKENLTEGDLIVISGMQNLSQKYLDIIHPVQAELELFNKKKVSQDFYKLVQHIKNYWIHPPSHLPLWLKRPSYIDPSQGQTGVIDDLLNFQEGGFFIECGALDGETASNTLFLERFRGWTGLLIEADPINYQQLLYRNRNSYTVPVCLGTSTYPSQMQFLAKRHLGKLSDSNPQQHKGYKTQKLHVQCFPLFSILLAINKTCVDLLTLDVEGVELQLLQVIPFDKITIKLLLVEYFHVKGQYKVLENFMKTKGFQLVTSILNQDLLFVNKKFV